MKDELRGLKLICIFEAAAGILVLVAGCRLLQLNEAYGVVFSCLGAVILASFYGLWKGLKWAWLFTVLASVFGVLGGIYMIFRGHFVYVYALLINFILIYYLTKPEVRSFFEVKSLEAYGFIPYVITLIFTAFLVSLITTITLIGLNYRDSPAVISSTTAAVVAAIASKISRKRRSSK